MKGTVDIVLMHLTDIIYISIVLSGLALVGISYIVPRAKLEISPLYKTVKILSEKAYLREELKDLITARIGRGEVIFIFKAREEIPENVTSILQDLGFQKGIIKGLCLEKGCVLRFLVRNKEILSCLSRINATSKLEEKFLGKTAFFGMFTNDTLLNFTACFKKGPALSHDLRVVPGIPEHFKYNGEDIYVVFANQSFDLKIKVFGNGEVRIV